MAQRHTHAIRSGGPSRRTVLRGVGGIGIAALTGGRPPRETRAQVDPAPAASDQSAGKVHFVALYGMPTDPAAFERYYHATHIPLATTIPYLKSGETALVLAAADGGPAPFYRFARLSFASIEELQAATETTEGQATIADLANFATGGVSIFIAEVDLTYTAPETSVS